MPDQSSGRMERDNWVPGDARNQIEEDDEMFWRSIDVVGERRGQLVVLQQLVVLRDGQTLPLDAHRTVGSNTDR